MDKLKRYKLKCAIFFGYNGRSFHGLQKAVGVRTIEEALEKAFFDANFIPMHNFGDIKKLSWSRASRTDKGVHASINVVKCNLEFTQDYLKDQDDTEDQVSKSQLKKNLNLKRAVKEVNEVIDENLKVFAIKLVTKNFVCKSSATSRKYEYILPLSILRNEKNKEKSDEEILEQLNQFLQVFKGTKNYHNYTKKGNFHNKSSQRFMMNLEAQFIETSIDTKDRYLTIFIHGQSFMYNQIRKMVGMIVSLFQNDLDLTFVENSFGQNHVDIWLAPSEGLLLDRVFFKGYNNKKDIPMKLDLDEEEEKSVKEFTQKMIYDSIIQENENQKVFLNWIDDMKFLQLI